MIIEDERRLREMLHAAVTDMGLKPTVANSAESALRVASSEYFALAVVDLNLPGMSGMELCHRFHQEKPYIQLIILTGFGDLEAARAAIRLEVVDFLTKPCGMDELENALCRARLRWLDRWAGAEHIPDPTEPPPAVPAVVADPAKQRSMDDMERALIFAALAHHNGNRQAAALELGISVRKLYYRLHQYQTSPVTKE